MTMQIVHLKGNKDFFFVLQQRKYNCLVYHKRLESDLPALLLASWNKEAAERYPDCCLSEG